MTTEEATTAVYNVVAAALKAEIVLSSTQDVVLVRRIAPLWAETRRVCLVQHPWRWARVSVDVTATATTDADNTAYAYKAALPADFVRLWAGPRDPQDREPARLLDFDVAAGVIYAHEAEIRYSYVGSTRGYDPAYWPATYLRLVGLDLAHQLSPRYLDGMAARDQLWRDRARAMHDAKDEDLGGTGPLVSRRSNWLDAHHGGRS